MRDFPGRVLRTSHILPTHHYHVFTRSARYPELVTRKEIVPTLSVTVVQGKRTEHVLDTVTGRCGPFPELPG